MTTPRGPSQADMEAAQDFYLLLERLMRESLLARGQVVDEAELRRFIDAVTERLNAAGGQAWSADQWDAKMMEVLSTRSLTVGGQTIEFAQFAEPFTDAWDAHMASLPFDPSVTKVREWALKDGQSFYRKRYLDDVATLGLSPKEWLAANVDTGALIQGYAERFQETGFPPELRDRADFIDFMLQEMVRDGRLGPQAAAWLRDHKMALLEQYQEDPTARDIPFDTYLWQRSTPALLTQVYETRGPLGPTDDQRRKTRASERRAGLKAEVLQALAASGVDFATVPPEYAAFLDAEADAMVDNFMAQEAAAALQGRTLDFQTVAGTWAVQAPTLREFQQQTTLTQKGAAQGMLFNEAVQRGLITEETRPEQAAFIGDQLEQVETQARFQQRVAEARGEEFDFLGALERGLQGVQGFEEMATAPQRAFRQQQEGAMEEMAGRPSTTARDFPILGTSGPPSPPALRLGPGGEVIAPLGGGERRGEQLDTQARNLLFPFLADIPFTPETGEPQDLVRARGVNRTFQEFLGEQRLGGGFQDFVTSRLMKQSQGSTFTPEAARFLIQGDLQDPDVFEEFLGTQLPTFRQQFERERLPQVEFEVTRRRQDQDFTRALEERAAGQRRQQAEQEAEAERQRRFQERPPRVSRTVFRG